MQEELTVDFTGLPLSLHASEAAEQKNVGFLLGRCEPQWTLVVVWGATGHSNYWEGPSQYKGRERERAAG